MPRKTNPLRRLHRDRLRTGEATTWEQLAEELGVAHGTLVAWARDRYSPSLGSRKRMEARWGIPINAWPLPVREAGRPRLSQTERDRRARQANRLHRKGVSKPEIARQLRMSVRDVVAIVRGDNRSREGVV